MTRDVVGKCKNVEILTALSPEPFRKGRWQVCLKSKIGRGFGNPGMSLISGDCLTPAGRGGSVWVLIAG